MNTLGLRRVEVAYADPSDDARGLIYPMTDFWIDGRSLAETLGVAPQRPWFGRTRFESSPEARERFKLELLGQVSPLNQFGSGRLVLFGCHCGADYCGVVSCRVAVDADLNTVCWLELAEERDGFEQPSVLEPVPQLPAAWQTLTFERTVYERTVLEFVRDLQD